MKAARILALLVAAALAAFLVWSATRPEDGETPGPGTPSGVPAWSIEGPGSPVQGTTATNGGPRRGVDPPPPPPPVLPAGTPVAPGQEVALDLPWKPGTGPQRFEIVDTQIERDKASGARNEFQHTQRVTVEVLDRADDGALRIRLTVDSLRHQVLLPDGRSWDFDSIVGDAGGLLEDPDFGPGMKATLPLLGKPLEFRLDATGRVVDADGVEAWRAAFLDAAEGLHRSIRAAAPTTSLVIGTWTEYLFPPLGGGKLRAGTPRPFQLRKPLLPPWEMSWKGTLDATHDDADAFRVEATAAPVVERGPGADSDVSAGIAKIQAVHGKDAYRAAWRYARNGVPGLLEAQIDAKFEVWVSRGGAPDAKGEVQYSPTYGEVVRRAVIRRTFPVPAVK